MNIALYQYLLSVHVVACFLVFYQHIMLGFSLEEQSNKSIRYVIIACRAVPLIQLPISAIRIWYSLSGEFVKEQPLDIYLDFVFSPMLTIALIWLMQLYLVKNCCCISKITLPKDIYAPIKVPRLAAFGALGYFLGMILYPLSIAHGISILQFIGIAFTSVTMIAMVEMAVIRFFHEGAIVITSNTLVTYFGSWVYFVHKVL